MRRRTDGDPSSTWRLPPPPWLVDAATAHEVDVELLDDDEPPLTGARTRPPSAVTPSAVTPQGRSPVRRLAAGALAVAGALVVTLNVATETRSTAAAARLAAVPGVLEPVTAPGTPWERPDAFLLGVVDDAVLVSTADRMLEALDATTGAVRWRVGDAGATGWCTLVSEDHEGVQFERTTPWRPEGADLACHRSGWWADGPDDEVRRRTRVEVVDPRSGRTTGTVEEDGRLVSSVLHAGDLVVVVARDDGTVLLTRYDPDAARAVWSAESGPGVATPDAAGTAVFQDGRTLTVRGRDRVTVALADGALLASHVPAVARRVMPPTTVTPLVSDSGAPVAILHRGGASRVVQRGAGRAVTELWQVTEPRRSVPLADVSGVLLLARPSEVVAHDRDTGRVRWRVRTAAAVDPVPLTDGSLALLPVPGRGSTALAAVDLADGLELWRTPLPSGTRLLVPAEGAVVVVARDGVHGLPVSP